MLQLFCLVVGEGRPFLVEIAAAATVGDLKKKIIQEIQFAGRADRLQLYPASQGAAWLGSKSQLVQQLKTGCIPNEAQKLFTEEMEMDITSGLDEALKLPIGRNEIHVLVVVPRADSMILDSCPHISVIDLLQQHPLPEGMEFTQAMDEPLGFRIPLMGQEEVSLKPDAFIHGQAEYRSVIDTFLYHSTISGSELDVVSIDFNWLALFPVLCNCVLYRDEVHESSSCPGVRPDAVLVKRGILVGKCESKASSKKMDIAAQELTVKMALAAYCTFPHGLTSIPVGRLVRRDFYCIDCHTYLTRKPTRKKCLRPTM
ncbi:hypothetical protein AeRB84_007518 [Aphanomyces euteiches]|nr:hypothetical protein AeRB84_007518 [Aphanomyces euteiches]